MRASDRIAPEILVQENRVACEFGTFLRHRPGPQARSPNDRRHPPRRARARVSARGPGVGVDVARFSREGRTSGGLYRGGLLALRQWPVGGAARAARRSEE